MMITRFFIMGCESREMGTPEARNLMSVRCDFIIYYLFLEGGARSKRGMSAPQARNPNRVISRFRKCEYGDSSAKKEQLCWTNTVELRSLA